MKRTISILVIVAMMLASVLAIVPAYAAEPTGTPVTNAAEFLAMAADGQYYLANDITISEPYASDFAGAFDGNGKTITVNGPMAFKKIALGTISNLTIVASDSGEKGSGNVGALAGDANGIFTNVHAVVNYEYTGNLTNIYVGGLIGKLTGAAQITGCTASGTINVPTENTQQSETSACAGLIAFMGGTPAEIKDCVNYVNIYSMQNRTNVGGILGQANAGYTVTIDGCINYGTITTTGGGEGGNVHCGLGGIVGQFSSQGNTTSVGIVKNCRNYADLATVKSTLAAGTKDKMVGGIIGRLYGPKTITVENCVNSGNIVNLGTGWASSGGIVGQAETYNYSWSANTECDIKVNYSINLGNIEGSRVGGIFGSTAQASSTGLKFTVSNSANYGEMTCKEDGKAGGIWGSTSDGSCATYTIINCYNAGNTNGGGIFGKADQATSAVGSTVNAELAATSGPVIIENCVNEGETKNAGILGAFSGVSATVKGCATTVADQAIAPESEKVAVTETAADAAAAKTAVLALVPANPADLDALVAANKDNDPADYTAGWDAFESALTQALIIANRASTAEDIKVATEAMAAAVKGLALNTNIDFTALDAVLAEAAEIEENEDLYTPASWAVFAAALEAANGTAEAEKQSIVNKAAEALAAAMAALEFKPDFDALDAEMAKHADLAEADYTTASWAVFKAALDTAIEARANENATGSYVNQVIADLAAAAAALDAKVALDSLNTKVADIKANYVKDQFTAKSYEPVTQALRAADEALKSGDVGAAGLATLIENLDKAIAGLLKRATFAELEPLTTECEALNEDDYTEESWAAFTEALDSALEAMTPAKKNNVSEAQEAELLEALKAAKDALIGWADYTEIDALIAEINGLKAEDYTADSWTALQTAIAAVETLKSNRNATKPESDEALANLQAAKAALVEAAAPTVEATQPEATEPTTSGGCGGTIAIGATVVVAILGTAIALKKKED